MKRTPLRPVSARRRATFAARRQCIDAVLARDGGCVFARRYSAHLREGGEPLEVPTRCWGVLDVHEPEGRHGENFLDPDECVALCRKHHDFAHDHPAIARVLGLKT